MVFLTDRQDKLLRKARELTDSNDELWTTSDTDTEECRDLDRKGLLMEGLPFVFIITPAGRAWLAEKEKQQ